jgi:ATP-dependent helicase/nuclease subunit A
MPNWTKEQKQAIEEKGNNILVAAAAGSGKTAVLVERIIHQVIEEQMDIDRLLVVTFTNAAAAEMRERVLDALYQKLEEDPNNLHLQKQVTLLNMASICTIDSFCLEVVKSHFYELDQVSPNFRIADTAETELLKQEVLEDLFEEKYEQEDPDFTDLVTTYTSYRDDKPLKDLVLKIHQFISSSPYPNQWLTEKVQMFDLTGHLEDDFGQTPWGRILLPEIEEELIDDLALLTKANYKLTQNPELSVFSQMIQSDITQLEYLKQNLNQWDRAYQIAQTIKFDPWPRKKIDSEEKEEAKKVRDQVKKRLYQKIGKILLCNSKQANQDIQDMGKTLKKLQDLIFTFDQIFSQKKREKNLVDFADIEHFALSILVQEKDGKKEPTEVAKEYQKKFIEIAIDEYQDSNLVQESILTAVSRGNNLFMVGDVKQSIYKFRQAMPELFLQKYHHYQKVTEQANHNHPNNEKNQSTENVENTGNIGNIGKENIEMTNPDKPKEPVEEANSTTQMNQEEKDLSGGKIQLFKNFRSRGNVLDFTNLIFEHIMSQELGEIEYTQEEFLNLGADYPEPNQSLITEIQLISLNQEDENKNNNENNNENENHNEDQNKEQEGQARIPENQNQLDNLEDEYKGKDNNDKSDKTDSNESKNNNNGSEQQNNEELAEDQEMLENIELEAKHIAQEIKKLVETKFPVYDRKLGTNRPIRYRDIAILLRSTKNKASIIEQEMSKLEIPVFSDSTEQYLDSLEIELMMSLLKIIDNPIQDIPLVAVLRSMVGGFTDNELVEIRLSDKQVSFYECMEKAKINVKPELSQKITSFLNQVKTWREDQEHLALDEFIWKIYQDTGLYDYVRLMPNGELRQANLKMLFERAKQYESASFKGLYRFIQFIERLQLSSGDLSPAKIIGEQDDVVRIMSIHKSKGLEFPIVFLANTNKQFNEQEMRNDSLLLHQELGIGAKYIDYHAQVQYDTLTREAVKLKMITENLAEEMRILYVALTRAKEKLYLTGVVKEVNELLEKVQSQIDLYPKEKEKMNPILLKKAKSYLEWIVMVVLSEKNNPKEQFILQTISPQQIRQKDKEQEKQKQEQKSPQELTQELNQAPKNEEMIQEIKQKMEFIYPFEKATQIPTKMSVSQIKELKQKGKLVTQGLENTDITEITKENQENTQNKSHLNIQQTKQTEKKEPELEITLPEFMKEDKKQTITPAQKGTIIHLCLQKLNLQKEYTEKDIKEFIEKLVYTHILLPQEAESINPLKILEFTNSNLGKELKTAKEIHQETPFYLSLPAKEIVPTEEGETIQETILVQGIIDLYYLNQKDELILVDYKTDYVTQENELLEKYQEQLSLYQRALEKALKRKVDQVYIYSTYLGREIEGTP